MTTTEDILVKSVEQLEALGEHIDTQLLEAIAAKIPKTSLDATLVAASDDDELDYIVHNFMKDKLEEDDAEQARVALDAVLDSMSEFHQKQRAVVYYLLVQDYGAESAYL